MDTLEVDQFRGRLADFTQVVFASLTRSGWRERGETYVRGLMLDGKRKSIQPMAARLPEVHEQALNHFMTVSPWDPVPVRQQLAYQLDAALDPTEWVLDDTGYAKSGTASPCVARQYSGTLGKVANCQIGVSLHLATDTASCPVNWRLFVPEAWDPSSDKASPDVTERRRKARIPDDVHHRPKWQLGLDMIDELIGWGLTPRLIVADAGYGELALFRQGLEDRHLDYIVGVPTRTTVLPQQAQRTSRPYSGRGPRSRTIYRDRAVNVKQVALAAGRRVFRAVTWREGSKRRNGQRQPLHSRFRFLRIRPAAAAHRRAHTGQDLPLRWLIVEWPAHEPEPTRYWLSNLPEQTVRSTLVRLAKQRWRIEHDYRELKDALGLDHYEGRTWQGWHHHVTLVSVAHGFLTLQRRDPKVPTPAGPSTPPSKQCKPS